MAQITIRLNTLGEVKEFNATAGEISADVDLRSGRYCVDAKSIMGIFSLNLGRPLVVECPALSEEDLRKKFAMYLAE